MFYLIARYVSYHGSMLRWKVASLFRTKLYSTCLHCTVLQFAFQRRPEVLGTRKNQEKGMPVDTIMTTAMKAMNNFVAEEERLCFNNFQPC